MTDLPAPTGAELAELRRAFAAEDAAREMIETANGAAGEEGDAPAARSLAMSRLYAYVQGRIPYPDAEIEAALRASPPLRAAQVRMLASGALYSFDLARAASDIGPLLRHGEGCALRYAESQADPNKLYVIVEVVRDGAQPAQLVLIDEDETTHRLDLPPPRRGLSQLLLDRESEALALLACPKTRAMLR